MATNPFSSSTTCMSFALGVIINIQRGRSPQRTRANPSCPHRNLYGEFAKSLCILQERHYPAKPAHRRKLYICITHQSGARTSQCPKYREISAQNEDERVQFVVLVICAL